LKTISTKLISLSGINIFSGEGWFVFSGTVNFHAVHRVSLRDSQVIEHMRNYRVLCSKETVKVCVLCLILAPFLRKLREREKFGYLESMIIICGGY